MEKIKIIKLSTEHYSTEVRENVKGYSYEYCFNTGEHRFSRRDIRYSIVNSYGNIEFCKVNRKTHKYLPVNITDFHKFIIATVKNEV